MSKWFFDPLERGKYSAILADPPWKFETWDGRKFSGGNHVRKDGSPVNGGVRGPPFETMGREELCALPVSDLASDNCVLFIWACWPTLDDAFHLIEHWGFRYKTCAFSWMKADPYRLFADDTTPFAGMGYWTRANTEPCLLATRGKPKRLNANVRQGIIAPRREHSRKPDGIHERIERLVAGPYVELFARQSSRPNWDFWGLEKERFNNVAA